MLAIAVTFEYILLARHTYGPVSSRLTFWIISRLAFIMYLFDDANGLPFRNQLILCALGTPDVRHCIWALLPSVNVKSVGKNLISNGSETILKFQIYSSEIFFLLKGTNL
jgi:hypothetical protein